MKLIVIGIDALSREIITRNSFPVMNSMNVRTIDSTLPYITPPGWTTMWTGLNPSHHGIFGIQSLQDYKNYGNKKRSLFTDDMLALNKWRIWDYLSKVGLKCIVRDVPMSLPLFDSEADVAATCHTELPEVHWRGWGIEALSEDKRGKVVKTKKVPGRKDPDFDFRIHSNDLQTVKIKKETYIKLAKETDADVLFLGFHEVDPTSHMFGTDHEALQIIIDELNEFLEALSDYPIMIISDHGFETYTRQLNLENFLRCRDLFHFDGKGPIFKTSRAYPVDCGMDGVSTQDWGIYLNTKDKAEGFLSEQEKIDLMTELIVQLNSVDDLVAQPKWEYYDIEGEFYERAPDIVLSSPMCRTFITSTFKSDDVIESFGESTHSMKSVLVTNFKNAEIDSITSLEDVYGAICSFVKVEDEKIIGDLKFPEDFQSDDEAVIERLKKLGYFE